MVMYLYLVQHADAKTEEQDPQRGLSQKGFDDIKKVAAFLTKLNLEVDEIFHSPKLRAKQTAQVLSEALGVRTTEADGLTPLDDPQIWSARLKNINKSIMLVGHLPHLSNLASLILVADREKTIISFKMAGVVCLKKEQNWTVSWMITPEVI
ncbi:MAG: phosphohistidine phosphatase SixA [Elusimicrobiales bacterium]